jgi:hypothetical protein
LRSLIDYRVDLTKPYLIVDMDDTHVVVTGTSKVLETTDGEFGGTEGTWRVPKSKLLSKRQKQALRWIRKNLGDKQADRHFDRLCALEISTHSNHLVAR